MNSKEQNMEAKEWDKIHKIFSKCSDKSEWIQLYRHIVMTFTSSERSRLGVFLSNMGEQILLMPSPHTSLKRSFGSAVCTKGRDVINASLWLVLTRNSWFTENNCKLHHQTDQNKCTKKTINTQLIKTNVWKRKDHYEKALLETRHIKWKTKLHATRDKTKEEEKKKTSNMI